MLNRFTKRLCEYGGSSLAPATKVLAKSALASLGEAGVELVKLLETKNGFYAFDSALHVFPFTEDCKEGRQDVICWNDCTTWKHAYPEKIDSMFCFAEDIFGYQFCIFRKHIGRFDPETGDVEVIAGTIEEWATLICSDVNVQTGYPVARAWKESKGIIKTGYRLVPIYPFVTSQGSYQLTNLYECKAVKGMLSRADFAKQISNVPDGERIKIVPAHYRK